MMQNQKPGMTASMIISRHLREGDEVVRCAAARALGRLREVQAAPDLVDALLDPDPDVRTDSMAALVHCARPQDGESIKHSLIGDPVKEVKVSAIEALAALGDHSALPVLRQLVLDRCDDEIAWEDDGLWDDWLDVQLAAIQAIGEIGDNQAINDLLTARGDEMGQSLDHAVFAALAKIANGGPSALVNFVRDRDDQVRRRALEALCHARPDMLVPLKSVFADDPSPELRLLVVGLLQADDPLVSQFVLDDPSAKVRRAALTAFAGQRLEIARSALSDSDEQARAIALECLANDERSHTDDDLAANMQVWLTQSGSRLSSTCATLLTKFTGEKARPVLAGVVKNSERPEQTRVAAVRSLAACADLPAVALLADLAQDPSRQIRTAALAGLAHIHKAQATETVSTATANLVAAIEHGFGIVDDDGNPLQSSNSDDATASKVESSGTRSISIAPDGQIIEQAQEDAIDQIPRANDVQNDNQPAAFPSSTLEAIQAPPVTESSRTPPLSPDELDHLASSMGAQTKKRVPVQGPDQIKQDIQRIAMRVSWDCPGEAIEQAIRSMLVAVNDQLKTTALATLSERSNVLDLSSETRAGLRNELASPNALFRGYAARAIANSSPNAADFLRPLLNDPDATVRIEAIRALGPDDDASLLELVRDPSPQVRKVVLQRLIDQGNADHISTAIDHCIQSCHVDTLALAANADPSCRDRLISILGDPGCNRQTTLVCLEALSPPI